ncbi:MAG: hypothetical protein GC152_12625 [Alphaproteobacteria bacterium]|nr:hypothetical protein [Alphaproteobacteria bacterium]
MILRRMIEHVRTQNWTAVALDFVIVVAGVFIGIQLGNWNEARASHVRYAEARRQFISETETNLRLAQTYVRSYETQLAEVRAAISILRRCETGPDALKTVERGLDNLRSTAQLVQQISAITFLTENEEMVAIQDEQERLRLQTYSRDMHWVLDGAEHIEHLPDRSPAEDHPMIGYGELSADYAPVNGADERPLILVVPLEEACQDAALAKHFYLWERIGVFAGLIGKQHKERLQANLKALRETP